MIETSDKEKDTFEVHHNAIFTVCPVSNFKYLKKMKEMMSDDMLEQNHENTYSKFIHETNQNLKIEREFADVQVKYGDSFQLFHEKSKRYLCFVPLNKYSLQNPLSIQTTAQSHLMLSFWEFPRENTIFSFETEKVIHPTDETFVMNSGWLGYLTCQYQKKTGNLENLKDIFSTHHFTFNQSYCLMVQSKSEKIQMIKWEPPNILPKDKDLHSHIINYTYLVTKVGNKWIKYHSQTKDWNSTLNTINEADINIFDYSFMWKFTILNTQQNENVIVDSDEESNMSKSK